MSVIDERGVNLGDVFLADIMDPCIPTKSKRVKKKKDTFLNCCDIL